MIESTKDIEQLAETFKALSDPTRLRIMKMLRVSEVPLCVTALASRLGVTQSAVSQHLRVLRQAGIVSSSRAGRRVHYTVDVSGLRVHGRLFSEVLDVK